MRQRRALVAAETETLLAQRRPTAGMTQTGLPETRPRRLLQDRRAPSFPAGPRRRHGRRGGERAVRLRRPREGPSGPGPGASLLREACPIFNSLKLRPYFSSLPREACPSQKYGRSFNELKLRFFTS